jgi:hypothetical protein
VRFSEHFGITRGPRDDWFDPVLTVDTRLFVDPFLVYAQEDGEFEGSHTEVIDFFNVAFKRIAKSDGSQSTLGYRKTMSDLVFPETPELCLGYTRRGTLGSGSGKGLARLIAGAIWEAIQAGVTQITHFEEISLLREGFGADRIGDMTANLLRRRVSAYTLHVCERHSIPTWPTFYKRGYYDPQEGRWMPLSVHAPRNPSTGLPLLLVPQQYLRELPTINADDFWDFCWDNENETLRNEFSDDVLRRVSKPEIIRLARRRPHLR